ncbi:MAG: hypothetical protein MKZ59_01515 [Deinococcales bacterium]|jgi:hypothetical protein|nr:hypothetical protein [Deinococcales bacterium]
MNLGYFRLIFLGSMLCAALSGCLKRTDSLAPIVSITNPPSGATRTTENLVIGGYALDDEGIVSIRVNGGDLMSDFGKESYVTEIGMKLVQFKFRALQEQEGEIISLIEVEDTSGRTSRLTHKLVVDATAPTLEFEVTELENGRFRVQGLAQDNLSVQSVRVAGIPLQFIPSRNHQFTIDFIPDDQTTIEVIDGAGNRYTQPLP